MKRFRGGLVFKAHRLLYHSTLGSRVIKKKKEERVKMECWWQGNTPLHDAALRGRTTTAVALVLFFCFFFTLITGPGRSLSLKLSDTRVYEPQIIARLGTTAVALVRTLPLGRTPWIRRRANTAHIRQSMSDYGAARPHHHRRRPGALLLLFLYSHYRSWKILEP